MAQQMEFNLKKPSAFHYDIFLLGFKALFVFKDEKEEVKNEGFEGKESGK
ncbi:hypothetical protein Fmac_012564 [Flemingia macrophylla]|uniref:Uncharacterized protein n=1 Tax=Flemingia macrophylla TaxID=520843 RepID=A0ABD1MRJ2_9FABA